jgi:hypothetical protein
MKPKFESAIIDGYKWGKTATTTNVKEVNRLAGECCNFFSRADVGVLYNMHARKRRKTTVS